MWSSAREVTGASCEEVVEAIALIAALAIDPKASTVRREALATAQPPSPSSSSTPTPTPTPTTTTTTTPTPTARNATPPREENQRNHVLHTNHFGVGAQIEGSFVADLVPAARLFGELTLRDDQEIVAPSFRAAFARSVDVDRHPVVGSARVRFTQGAIEACPIRGSLGAAHTSQGSALAFRPCAGFSAGVIDADGFLNGVTRSRSRPWSTVSVEGRVVWSPLRSRAFFVALEIGALTPLVRETFFFTPLTAVYRAPVFAGFGRLGLTVMLF